MDTPTPTGCLIAIAGDGDGRPPVLELRRMRQQKEVRLSEDDWTGRTNAGERRRLQNRLNQRLYRRRRKAQPKQPESGSESNHPAVLPLQEARLCSEFTAVSNFVENPVEIQVENERPGSANSSQCSLSALCHTKNQLTRRARLEEMMTKFELAASQNYMQGSPRTDQLLTLIQFNVLRALMSNSMTMGWTLEWLECSDPISPWNIIPSDSNLSCPKALCPTPVQRTIEHHPWIDLWPIPKMRDNILLALDQYNEDQLCNDLVEFGSYSNEHTGLICWSDPWDPAGWEISESFMRNWGWTMKGCVELLVATNFWRSRRGERPLIYEV